MGFLPSLLELGSWLLCRQNPGLSIKLSINTLGGGGKEFHCVTVAPWGVLGIHNPKYGGSFFKIKNM